MSLEFPLENVLNTGSIDEKSRGEGFLEALDLVFNVKVSADTQHLIIADGNLLYDQHAWDINGFSSDSTHLPESDVTVFGEKDMILMGLSARGVQIVRDYLNKHPLFDGNTTSTTVHDDEYARLLDWMSSANESAPSIRKTSIRDNPTFDWTSSSLTVSEYLSHWANFIPSTESPPSASLTSSSSTITARSYARAGLIGNPSDGFYGKTISVLLSNWFAEIVLIPNASALNSSISIVPNPTCDPLCFASIRAVGRAYGRDGFEGAARLLWATIKVFLEFCRKEGMELSGRGFKIAYQTNIPRQVGLAGSSALITALVKSLLRFYNLDDPKIVPLHIRANLALSVERDELGIAAGHQDRVIQVYGGCVYMDFEKHLMQGRGYGEYEQLGVDVLPEGLWLGNVTRAMSTFASYANRARQALISNDAALFASLMDANFDMRRSLYGDAVIGSRNLRIIELARSFGHAAKFSGSGGCVVGLWRGDKGDMERSAKTKEMRNALEKEGQCVAIALLCASTCSQ
ncbi:hypothetical protein HK104_001879 [Borealophlyctis nickersoniae]|nr:hypothetical protein HK104_001879 [Borealophlyctis nickersoniae]